MAKVSKRVTAYKKELDSTKRYSLEEAIDMAKKYAKAKFDERLDVSFRLGVDPRKSDQMVRGSCSLPNGTGQQVRVLVFAKGEKEKEALDAGADFAGSDELVKKIQEGWLEFDRVVATPDMMAVVGRIGRILGPRGLMPNPKVGTVTFNVAETVKTIKQGQVQFRTDKGANVHATTGLISFDTDKLAENITALHDTLVKLKPASAKGTYVKNVSISTTMGPGFRVEPGNFK